MPEAKVTDSPPSKASRTAHPAVIVHAFHTALPAWYEKNKRDLPWRHTRAPYAIALSEFMLQQTQVVTALPYYERWLRLFPTWRALAEAPIERVLKAWEGLGYYQRARNLHKLAQAVAASASGELPPTAGALQELPGIGPYTARAIASFAFGENVGVLDGNVIRVLTRVFAIDGNVADRTVLQQLWKLVESLTPPREADTFNQAMMEIGALVCLPRKPACLLCPFEPVCRGKNEPERYPVKERATAKSVTETIAVIAHRGKWWCEQTAAARRLSEFWRFPEFDASRMTAGAKLLQFKYTITNHRIDLTALAADWNGPRPKSNATGRWLTREEMESLPFSAAHRKIARKLSGDSAPHSSVGD